MSTLDSSLPCFIDHYILLLAVRFNAPLHVNALRVDDMCDAEAAVAWERVSQCVRDTLSRPFTPDEARQLRHVDVRHFTAAVCRARALHFSLQQQQQETDATRREETGKGEKTRRAKGPSTFDVTRESLRSVVERIHAAARARLPTTIPNPQNNESDESDEGDGEEVAVVEFPLRSAAEVERDMAVAQARDALLTRIQSMQAAFFEEHRRWVDVPMDWDKPQVEKPREDVVEALRRSVCVSRPPRPSQMREEDYTTACAPIGDASSDLEAAFMEKIKSAGHPAGQQSSPSKQHEERGQQQQQQQQPQRSQEQTVELLTQNRDRTNRWTIVEYDGEESDDSDVMD